MASVPGGQAHRFRRAGPGASFDYGSPSPLFRESTMVQMTDFSGGAFDVSADGQRFLIASSAGQRQPPITVVLNWPAGVGR